MRLKRELKAPEERVARAGAAVRGNGQDTKCRTTERKSNSGSGRRPNASSDSQLSSPTGKKGR